MKSSEPFDMSRFKQSLTVIVIFYGLMVPVIAVLSFLPFFGKSEGLPKGIVDGCGMAAVWIVIRERNSPVKHRVAVYGALMILNLALAMLSVLLGLPVVWAIESWLFTGLLFFVIGERFKIFSGLPEVPEANSDLSSDHG